MPKIPIPEPPLPKVFALTTPEHLLRKLWWEVREFEAAEKADSDIAGHIVVAYHAMNCSITAWHLADWVWQYGEDDERQYLSARLNLKKADFACFVEYLRRDSRALNCCRDVATGAKHMKLQHKGADPDVEAEVVWDIEPMTVMSPVDAPLRRYTACLVVHDSQGTRPARDVFKEAFDYWQDFLERHGYKEARFISAE